MKKHSEKQEDILVGVRKDIPPIDPEVLYNCVGESVEWEPLFQEDLEVGKDGKIDEANAVNFDGKAYPRDGWSVIMAGGPGSGKGFVISKMVLMDAKIVDVDHLKIVCNIVSDGKSDLKNPDEVASLHKVIVDKGWKDALTGSLFTTNNKLANIIFDMTGKSVTYLQNNTRMIKGLGYKVSLVWVVTNRQVAMARNLLREKVVPEPIFHQIHNQVNDTIISFLHDPFFSEFVDEAWIVFSGPSVAEIDSVKKANVRDMELKNRAFKLLKRGKAFTTNVKDKGQVVDIAGKMVDWLGPDEVGYQDSKIYKSFDKLRQELDLLEKDAKCRPLPGQKFSAIDYDDFFR